MKKIFLISLVFLVKLTVAQTVSEANVYPSNLEENMYFEKFDQSKNLIEGLFFMILSDGDNSEYVTPAFEVSLYLLPEGSSSREDLIFVKKYNLPGIYHFGSKEYSNEKVDLNETSGIQPGNYRFGIWVNSDEAFAEDRNDNATLFKTPITIVNATGGKTNDTWSDWDNDDDEEEEEW